MNKYKILESYVDIITKTNQHCLIVKGSGGIGKTHTILKALENKKLKGGQHYIYVAGYLTPLKFFELLRIVNTLENPKILFIDDIDSLLTNKINIFLLKSALWEVNGKRLVHYDSSKVENNLVDFKGKIILALNNIPNSIFNEALLDRTIFYKIRLTKEELVSHIENKVIPHLNISNISNDEKLTIWNQIKQYIRLNNFTVRTYLRAIDFYKSDKNKWFTLFIASLNLSDEDQLVYDLNHEETQESVRILKFGRNTGKSERTYYNIKKRLNLKKV